MEAPDDMSLPYTTGCADLPLGRLTAETILLARSPSRPPLTEPKEVALAVVDVRPSAKLDADADLKGNLAGIVSLR